jgi:hypothetical protein
VFSFQWKSKAPRPFEIKSFVCSHPEPRFEFLRNRDCILYRKTLKQIDPTGVIYC